MWTPPPPSGQEGPPSLSGVATTASYYNIGFCDGMNYDATMNQAIKSTSVLPWQCLAGIGFLLRMASTTHEKAHVHARPKMSLQLSLLFQETVRRLFRYVRCSKPRSSRSSYLFRYSSGQIKKINGRVPSSRNFKITENVSLKIVIGGRNKNISWRNTNYGEDSSWLAAKSLMLRRSIFVWGR
jgi:hypothetical protein